MPEGNWPHSIALWFKWEVHEKTTGGMLSGSPINTKDYTGVIHCKSKEDALEIANVIVENLKERVKECQEK